MKNKYDFYQLIKAILRNDCETVKTLLNHGVELNNYSVEGETPLTLALKNDFLDIAETLIAYNINTNTYNKKGKLPLDIALEKKQESLIPLLLWETNNSQESIKTAKKTLKAYPEFACAIDETGSTLLHHAVSNENLALAKALISAGADVNAKDNNGNTPAHLLESAEMAKPLIKAHANFDIQNNDGNTPLHYAKNPKITASIVPFANLNVKNALGNTPLHTASLRIDKGHMQSIIDGGADINATNNYNMTPLHNAVRYQNKLAVDTLLSQKSINLNIIDKFGKTPYAIASSFEDNSILNKISLKSARIGADFASETPNTKTTGKGKLAGTGTNTRKTSPKTRKSCQKSKNLV